MNQKIMSVLVVLMMCATAIMAADLSASGSDAEPAAVPGIPEPQDPFEAGPGEYAAGFILVKDSDFSADRLNVPYTGAEILYPGSDWHKVLLPEGLDAKDALAAVKASGAFEDCDLSWILESQAVPSVSGNPLLKDQEYLDTQGIKKAWGALADRGRSPGGDRNVVVAVVDTGVCYTHEDIRDNVWHNPGEIPGNGIDDDGNGYVDDTVGWNFVAGTNDPADDHGHGSHVAGIIAASDNDKGIVGVAYNCQVMCLKAGDAESRFTDADMAAAIAYAARNGAQVINLSIGGAGGLSDACYDAIFEAFRTCIVVAAAGNETNCCNGAHRDIHPCEASYPGCIPGVIGVMSTHKDGIRISGFSNYDDTPFDSSEYDVFAAGSDITSLGMEDGKYVSKSGTSMACPVVSGIAALLLSAGDDRSLLQIDRIKAAMVGSGTVHPGFEEEPDQKDDYHTLCDAYLSMQMLSDPGLQPMFAIPMTVDISDHTTYGSGNNADGCADAGETVALSAAIWNRGFGDADCTLRIVCEDANAKVVKGSEHFGTVGTYRFCDNGPHILSDSCLGFDRFVTLSVDPACPDGYEIPVVVIADYTVNGETFEDYRVYGLEVSAKRTLPEQTEGVTEFTADAKFFLKGDLRVPRGSTAKFARGCTVVAEEGARIIAEGDVQFFGADIRCVSGPLVIEKSADSRVEFFGTTMRNLQLAGDLSDASDTVRFSGCTYTADGIGDVRLYNFDGSRFVGGDGVFSVSGASGSVFELVGASDGMTFEGRSADCIAMMNGVSGQSLDFRGEVSNVLVTQDRQADGRVSVPVECRSAVSGLSFHNCEGVTSAPSVPFEQLDRSGMWAMISDVDLLDSDGMAVDEPGNGVYTLKLVFSKPVGSGELEVGWYTEGQEWPVHVDGGFVTPSVWKGEVDLSSVIRGAPIYIDAEAPDGSGAVLPMKGGFGADVTPDEEIYIEAYPSFGGDGAELMFFYPMYDTMMGFNVYRSETPDGERTLVNDGCLLPYQVTYEDRTAEPGKTYWYTMTVLDTDRGTVDTVGTVSVEVPAIEAETDRVLEAGKDSELSCRVTGIEPEEVVFHYEHAGPGQGFTEIGMTLRDGVYTVTVPGEHISGDVFCYYITATDGVFSVHYGDGRHPAELSVEHRDGVPVYGAAAALMLLGAAMLLFLRRRQ